MSRGAGGFQGGPLRAFRANTKKLEKARMRGGVQGGAAGPGVSGGGPGRSRGCRGGCRGGVEVEGESPSVQHASQGSADFVILL